MSLPAPGAALFRSRAFWGEIFFIVKNTNIYSASDSLLARFEDFVLQMEVSAVTEGNVMAVTHDVQVKITTHALSTSTLQNQQLLKFEIKNESADREMYKKRVATEFITRCTGKHLCSNHDYHLDV